MLVSTCYWKSFAVVTKGLSHAVHSSKPRLTSSSLARRSHARQSHGSGSGKRERKAGRVRYWRYGQAEKSPDLAISDLSRFLPVPLPPAWKLGALASL